MLLLKESLIKENLKNKKKYGKKHLKNIIN
jgi:hypothetical protein